MSRKHKKPKKKQKQKSAGARPNPCKALLTEGRNQEALVAAKRLLAQAGQEKEGLVCQCQALLALQRYSDALDSATRLLEAVPNQPQAAYVGIWSLFMLKRIPEGLDLANQAVAAHPDHVQLQFVRCSLLIAAKRHAQALDAAQTTLALNPAHAGALLNKALALNALWRFEEAVSVCRQLEGMGIRSWQIYNTQAEALSGLQRFGEAGQVFDRARAANAAQFDAYHKQFELRPVPKDSVPIPFTPQSVYVDFVVRAWRQCDWRDYQQRAARVAELARQCLDAGMPSPLRVFRSLQMDVSPEFRRDLARDHARRIADGMRPVRNSLNLVWPETADTRLRIGYVSADFRQHPVGQVTRTLFGLHERRDFEIFGYALNPDDGGSYRRDIADGCDRFSDVHRLSNADVARKISADGIHILVDLMGYTQNARPEIFALRPAPVQATYLGFTGTMGADFMDYAIVDPVVVPETLAQFYTERLVYMPHSYFVCGEDEPVTETGMTRADQGLPEDAFVFCGFNKPNKVEPEIFDAWMQILREVAGSVLWLRSKSPEDRVNLRREAEARGVSGDRLVFAERVPGKGEHLERHGLADLFLDTRYYNAHTTAVDALWAGLPVLTCPGDQFPSRVGASLLKAVGLPEMIVGDMEAFVRRAVQLASHPQELSAIRARLTGDRQKCPLFDTKQFVGHLEQGYRMIWDEHRLGRTSRIVRVAAR